mmetsp:Transcript_94591/g.294224  ORF Transcript_94591/g.294224 Transcript_94591/m.294224 type:complete len:249 (-) Transcript_94591:54-800(-)
MCAKSLPSLRYPSSCASKEWQGRTVQQKRSTPADTGGVRGSLAGPCLRKASQGVHAFLCSGAGKPGPVSSKWTHSPESTELSMTTCVGSREGLSLAVWKAISSTSVSRGADRTSKLCPCARKLKSRNLPTGWNTFDGPSFSGLCPLGLLAVKPSSFSDSPLHRRATCATCMLVHVAERVARTVMRRCRTLTGPSPGRDVIAPSAPGVSSSGTSSLRRFNWPSTAFSDSGSPSSLCAMGLLLSSCAEEN